MPIAVLRARWACSVRCSMGAAAVDTFSKVGAVYMAVLLTTVGAAKVACAETFRMEAKAAPALGGRALLAYTLYPNWAGENT